MNEGITLKVARAHHQSEVGLGRARVDTATRTELQVEVGDIIEIIGKRKTAAKVFRASHEDENKGIIRIDGMIRGNAGVSIGEKIVAKKAEAQRASKVVVAPKIPQGKKVKFGQGVEDLFKKGLMNRPLVKGDEIIIPNIALIGDFLPFVVISTVPSAVVTVAETTELMVKNEAVEISEVAAPMITYDDVGGLENELQRVREMIELPLKHPELFERLGIDPPKGVLLYGPPGTGKTLIAKAVANEAGASFYSIQGPEIMSKYYGQSEEKLREKFEEAEKSGPSIIFIDELDSIAPKREEVQGEVERRVVAQLLTLMDGLSKRGHVIVIGATNREDAIDPALRRPGRFDREIEIGVPTRDGRREIMLIHTRRMPLEEGFNLEKFIDLTYGFVGADLAALAREAAMKTLVRYIPEIDLDKPIPADILEKMKVCEADFYNALKEVEPSAMREVQVEIPNVTWKDVGGLEQIKKELWEAIELPLKSPDSLKRLGVNPPRGILLYGPPGTGKTLIAKAIANETKANFIAVKGPEVMSKWVGESEKAIRQIFKKAKQVSPSIIFLDELDAIAPQRGLNYDSGASERVVDQILTSLDGLESLGSVTVVAATNRPDIVDKALLRPGRFDKIMLIPVPDRDSRLEILKVHMAAMPLKGVDIEDIAERTEGFVGADIESLCREAAFNALRGSMDATEVRMQDFEKALTTVFPSTNEETMRYYEKFGHDLKTSLVRKGEKAGYGYYR
ncbi:MAG: CDC48 family AAA ATPase [Thermoplasmata archaeon]|nr:CDC48 family AAA ATPase [Candidatus Sysuiplasma acidicola]MBX8638562.1 CDC48 family AAA ATPase [Candidatus Sysuiplasma acidicola]MBX8646318.1 CDC48 family AAA ATPase [Candidatus Sysuiplasma acidicola]MDH2904788.1 CDC48 family AAA ATPase [Methanomassiliicoccales archaeon]